MNWRTIDQILPFGTPDEVRAEVRASIVAMYDDAWRYGKT